VRSHRRILYAVCLATGVAAALTAFTLTSRATASGSPFTAVPAVGNLSALNSSALFTPPPETQKMPPEIRPGFGATHQLGSVGYAWLASGGVCVAMANAGPGGCFSQFTKPVTLYLWGDATGFKAAGVVPDSVAGLVLVTSGGDVPVTISSNAFETALPANTAITGERVTLTSGQTFVNDDPVSLPHV
jgi:hypothetical protein